MKEKTLIRICIVSIIIGLFIMYYSNKSFVPETIPINQVSEDYNFIKVRGNVNSVVTSKSGTTFIEVSDDTADINIVVFKHSILNIDEIKTGNFIEIIGTPQKYKEKMEIIANKIQLVKSDLV